MSVIALALSFCLPRVTQNQCHPPVPHYKCDQNSYLFSSFISDWLPQFSPSKYPFRSYGRTSKNTDNSARMIFHKKHWTNRRACCCWSFFSCCVCVVVSAFVCGVRLCNSARARVCVCVKLETWRCLKLKTNESVEVYVWSLRPISELGERERERDRERQRQRQRQRQTDRERECVCVCVCEHECV